MPDVTSEQESTTSNAPTGWGSGTFTPGEGPLAVWRRFRVAIVTLPLIIGLIVAGAIGARLLWEEVPSRDVAALDVCWNGTEAPSGTCPVPQGTKGLAWVFPRFDPNQPDCKKIKQPLKDSGRATEWRCISVLRGHRIEIGYRSRTNLGLGLDYLRKYYRGAPSETSLDGSRVIWRPESPDADGRYVMVAGYENFPYTLTLWASSVQLRDEASRTLVRFRPTDQLTGRPKR